MRDRREIRDHVFLDDLESELVYAKPEIKKREIELRYYLQILLA